MTRAIFSFAIIRFVFTFIHWMVFAHLPVLLKGYGLTDPQIGLLVGLYSLSSMFLMVPMGVFSDMFSPKHIIVVGAVFLGGYFASLLVVRSFVWLIPAVLLGGFGAAALMVVIEALYLKHFGQEKRGERVALYQLSTYVGYGLGPLVGGMFLALQPELLFPAALVGAALVLVVAFLLPDSAPIVFSFADYRNDLRQPKPLFLVLCVFVISSHFGVEQTSFSLFMNEDLGFSPVAIGYIFSGLGLWMACIVSFIGRLHDRREDVFLFFLGGLFVSSLFQILTAWSSGFWSLLTIRLFHTTGDAVALLELGVLTALFFPYQRLGGNSGLLYAVRTLATFGAAVLAGEVNRKWGYTVSFILNGLFVLGFVVASVVFIRMNGQRMRSVGWRREGTPAPPSEIEQ